MPSDPASPAGGAPPPRGDRKDNIRNLLLAGAFNGVARWCELLFVGVYVLELTGSAFYVAFVAMLRLLPLSFGGLIAGAFADRLGRRRLFLWATGVVAVASAMQFALSLSGALQLWMVVAGAFLSGMYWATDWPLRRTMLGEAVSARNIAPAMSVDAALNNGTRMVGPLLGGVTLQWFGLNGAFLFATLIYVVTFGLVFLVVENDRRDFRGFRLLDGLLEGLRTARANRRLVGTLAVSAVYNLSVFPALSMIPVICNERFGMSATMIGVMAGVEGLGALAASLLIARYLKNEKLYLPLYQFGALLSILMVAAFSFAPLAWLAALALLGVGLGSAGFSAMQTTLVFLASPRESRGRLMGLLTLSIGVAPLGFLHVGWLAELLGAPLALLVVACEGASLLLAVQFMWPEMRGSN